MWMTGLQAFLSGDGFRGPPEPTLSACGMLESKRAADLEPLGLKEVFFEGGPDTRAGDGVSHLSLHLSNVAVERHQKHNFFANSDTYSSLHVPI